MASFVLTQAVGGGDTEVVSINGQPVLVFVDPTRGSPSKLLSVADHIICFSDNTLDNQGWIQVGNANDAAVGYIADLDGTIVSATGHCVDTSGNSKTIHLFVNDVDQGSIGTLNGVDVSFVNTTLDIDFNQTDKIRLQAQQGSGGAIGNTLIKLTLKRRA